MKCSKCDWNEFNVVVCERRSNDRTLYSELECRLCGWPQKVGSEKAEAYAILNDLMPSSEPTDMRPILKAMKTKYFEKLIAGDPLASVAVSEVSTLMSHESDMTLDWLRQRYSKRLNLQEFETVMKDKKDREYMKARSDMRLQIMREVASGMKEM